MYAGAFTLTSTATVKFRAYARAGNAGSVSSQRIQIDSLAPTVSIAAPSPGARVTRKVVVKATATDTGGSGVATVSFYADGTLIGSDASAPYSVNWSLANVAKGSHTLTAVARDNAANTATSSPATVSVA